MSAPLLFSIIDSPTHGDYSALYRRLGIEQLALTSMRKAIHALKQRLPDFVVAEFRYGYGNNYAGINVSNLDVFLHSLRKYTTDTRVIVLVERRERQYVERLAALFPLHAILVQPVSDADLARALDSAAA